MSIQREPGKEVHKSAVAGYLDPAYGLQIVVQIGVHARLREVKNWFCLKGEIDGTARFGAR